MCGMCVGFGYMDLDLLCVSGIGMYEHRFSVCVG
jgi:hypothetical protein